MSFVEALVFTMMAFAAHLTIFLIERSATLGNSFLVLIFMGFSLVTVWVGRRTSIDNYNKRQVRVSKWQEEKELVSQLLPAHVISFDILSL